MKPAMEGKVVHEKLHEKTIPSSFQEVAVTEVLKKTSFDEELVIVGEIIAWLLK